MKKKKRVPRKRSSHHQSSPFDSEEGEFEFEFDDDEDEVMSSPVKRNAVYEEDDDLEEVVDQMGVNFDPDEDYDFDDDQGRHWA